MASRVPLSLVLLVGAGMFLQTLSNYSRLNPGFDRDHILSVHLNTDLVGHTKDQFPPLYQRLIRGVDEIPGVRSSAVATCSLSDDCPDASDMVIEEPEKARASLSVLCNSTGFVGLLQHRGIVWSGVGLLQQRTVQPVRESL